MLRKMMPQIVRLIVVVFAGQLTSPSYAEMTCSQNVMCLSTKSQDEGVWFTAINKMSHLPLAFSVELDLTNLDLTKGTNEIFVLEAGEKRRLFYLESRGSGRWHYSYKFHWAYGDLAAEHDADHLYRLPFAPGERFAVSQGCNGHYSHTGEEKYAVDFSMPVNSPVHAARSGRVVAVKQDSDRGGPSKQYEDDANHVFIQHLDGTLGFYFHLAKQSVAVELGSQVAAGDLIARSGNTGFSSGPHLHFEISRPVKTSKAKGGLQSQSLPFTFETTNGPVSCPEEDQRLGVKD